MRCDFAKVGGRFAGDEEAVLGGDAGIKALPDRERADEAEHADDGGKDCGLNRQANNDVLVKSNIQYQDKMQRIQKEYIFYKNFFVQNKDKVSQSRCVEEEVDQAIE